MLRYLLFDLDNTLYPASSGLDREIDRRMTFFVSNYLGIDPEESRSRRRACTKTYGTTLQWLRSEFGFADLEDYFDKVHPLDVDAYLVPDADLVRMLDEVGLPKSILTNSPMEHALRVLRRLGIEDRFERIFDIRYNGYRGKPYPEVYERVLRDVGSAFAETLFVDDLPQYLAPFRERGGHCVLVDEDGEHSVPAGAQVIKRIAELGSCIRLFDRDRPPNRIDKPTVIGQSF